ncbi:uncharacterized protein LOC121369973 [Gigantopelta aegis]|uniref:uncharacterized protein LOC121369973 n=1 Tax=Gigantopelta aegis TaxID=1735272 RepID=UPI001B88C42F|nr:uncharacterized protein LOC121369973 [Gigantopelta aegis]
MSADVEDWIKNCDRCLRRKTPTNARAPLVSITSTQPLELVCMDFLTLETSKGGYQHLLIITDHFTRYAQAIPTRNMTARTTAEAFYHHFVMHYGIPLRIHSDQGANFESKLLKELCLILGMDKSRTTSYHPMGNGMCERFNRTLLNMLGTLNPNQKKDWKTHVAPLVHAYNCTRHESTGYSPFFLMFGREPRLPIDLAFGINTNQQHHSLTSYATALRERLQQSYELATEASKIAQGRQKGGYDMKVRGAVVQPGDRVLVKILAFDGKHKLADRWEDDVYLVLSQPNQDIPVFVVRKENGEGRRRTLHRNHLLPIGSLPGSNQPRPKPRNRVVAQPVATPTRDDDDDESIDLDSSQVIVLAAPNDLAIISDQTAEIFDSDSQVSGDDQLSAESESVSSSGDDHILQHSVHEDDSTGERLDEEVEDGLDIETSRIATASDDSDTPPQPEPPPRPTPRPRRSTRDRRRPEWQTSGEYVMSQNVQRPDWQNKCKLLEQLAKVGVFEHISDAVSRAIVSIVDDNDK